MATKGAADGLDILIVTGDRDSYQLVQDPNIKVVYNKRGVSDYAIYDEAGILERTGVTPQKYVEYAALRGDNSDNLPGVPGVGEKTAAKLINKYGGIDGLYADLDSQTPKLRENLAASEEQVRLNVVVMELIRDMELDVEPASYIGIEPYDDDEVRKLFDFLEFRTLYNRLPDAFSLEPTEERQLAELAVNINAPSSGDEIVKAVAALQASSNPISVAGSPAGFAIASSKSGDGENSSNNEAALRVLWIAAASLPRQDGSATDDQLSVARSLSELFAQDGPGLYAHDAKPIIRSLLDHGIDFSGLALDTSLAAYLLDPAGNSYPLDVLLKEKTEFCLPDEGDTPEGQLDFDQSARSPAEMVAYDAAAVATLAPKVLAEIDEQGLRQLNDEVEVPLVRVLARMERAGIGVDRKELQRLNADMTAEADSLSAEIQKEAGEEFNVNSTKKLREILFEKLELTPQKKTKTGYSTDQATLEKLSGEHPIIDHLLRYREVEKLRSTYGQSLLDSASSDDRIHATFNQTVARTGRLSSENPNLHNIPVRTELGRSFRKAFVPAKGKTLLVADYNQIELRCIAHLAEDPGLIEAFTTSQDVHAITAARVFDVDQDDVSFEQRSKAKMVSYGLAYGMEAYGLGQRLGIPTGEAQVILDAYFDGFPAVKEYMDRTVTEARNRGYTMTLFGRRRAIPELMSDNRNMRQAGERQAMNAGIQGLAADIFKVALINLDAAVSSNQASARVVLQVHDEVIVEIEPSEKDKFAELVVDEMTNAFELQVPLEVNLSFGDTWADAKD